MDAPSFAFQDLSRIRRNGARTQVRDDRNCELADAFVAQRENKMMAIYQILPSIWAHNYRNA